MTRMWNRVAAAAGCFAAIMGFSRLAYGVLVPGMRASLGGDFATYGAIGAANLAGYFVGSLLAVRLGGRRDRVPICAISLGSMCAAMALTAASANPWELGVLRFIVGATSGVALAITLALGVERVPHDRRGLAASIVWAGGAAGMAIASALCGHGLLADWRTAWVAMGAAGAVATVALIFTVRDTGGKAMPPDDGAPLHLWSPSGYLPLGVAYFAYGFAYVDVITFFPAALARSHAAPPSLAGTLLGCAGIAGAILWGPLVDRYRNGFPVAVAAGACGLGSLGIASDNGKLALGGAILFGLAFIGVPAMIGALAQQREPAHRYARAFASITAFLGIAQIIGPYSGGVISDHLGIDAAIAAGALGFAACAALAGFYKNPATLPRQAERPTLAPSVVP